MVQNLFEEFQEKKRSLITLAKKAVEYGWIIAERQQEIVKKLESDVLTIGVIGQMKCGKSTFLNAFVFEDDILPAATTPMTAALSVITYGETKRIAVEFYTQEEWEEQKLTALRSLEEVKGNALEESKIKAAKELVEKASKLGTSLNSFLGKTQEDKFANLIEYVGAEGRFVSITKLVTIYYPKEYLKGVEIVDTPGFNDPIVSREERTKAFLKKADVVLMMLYAGRPFDVTDREILLQNVRHCGIGKVIIGINKYDIPYENGETEEEIKDYVKQQIKGACKAYSDDSLTEILKQAEPIPLSAEMALLSELSMGKITSNEAYKHAWKRACDIFEISSQNQMREKSHLDLLASIVRQMVENEKEKILFHSVRNSITAAYRGKKEEIDKVLLISKNYIADLSKPDDELEEKYNNIGRAERRLNKKMDSLGVDIENSLNQIIKEGRYDLEDTIDESFKKIVNIVESVGSFSSFDGIVPKINAELDSLKDRRLKRSVEFIFDKAKDMTKDTVQEFIFSANEIFMRYIPEFEGEDFVKSISKNILFKIDGEMFEHGEEEEEDNSDDSFGSILSAFFNGATFGLLRGMANFISHDSTKEDFLYNLNSIRRDFNPSSFLEPILLKKDEIINKIKEGFIDEVITPLKQQIEEIRSKVDSKETKLAEEKEKVEKLQKQLSEINQQKAEMDRIF